MKKEIVIVGVGSLLLAGAGGYGPGTLVAENVYNFTAEANKRFVSGYDGGVVITQAPVMNTSPLFVAAGYDLSGIGWNTYTDVGKNANALSVALLSPMHYAHANHHSIGHGGDLTFLGSHQQLYFAHTQTRTQLSTDENSDASLGMLTAPIPKSAHVTYYGIVDRGDVGSNYVNIPLMVYGWYGVMGLTKVTSANWSWDGTSSIQFYGANTIAVQGGDSGSPSLTAYQGALSLVGTRYSTYSGYYGGTDAAWVDPYVVAKANAAMASSNYAVKVTAVATKTWSGLASSGRFTDAGNWQEGAAPNREGISFNADSAHAAWAVNLDGLSSIKGMIFEQETGTDGQGFTFSGHRLQIGTGGLINNSQFTQTFNQPIQFYYLIGATSAHDAIPTGAQHWTANRGNWVMNGAVDTNGFQLVVDGVKDTAIHGMVVGSGGIGKDSPGKLELTHANQYTGGTSVYDGVLAVNNTTGSATGSGDIHVWAGRLQGCGQVDGTVIFHDNGDATTLSPGNADQGLYGRMTIGRGLVMTPESTLSIRIQGTMAGTNHDQVTVTNGDVDLGNAILRVQDVDGSACGDSRFWLIHMTGSGTLTGRFRGLADGDQAGWLGSQPLYIHYQADWETDSLTGGNDVVLVLPEPASGLALWWFGTLWLFRWNRRGT